jgi:hypothetical protein
MDRPEIQQPVLDSADRLLTVDQVSEQLGLKPKTVHQLCRDGKLGYVPVTDRKRGFLPEQIAAFIQSRRVDPPKKSVDRNPRERIRSPRKGGETEKSATVSVEAQLLEEMRSWL